MFIEYTLGALTVAIGRVISNSTVVVENIYRRLTDSEEQLKGENLIISATTEVFKPIMSSTLVTIMVFTYHLCIRFSRRNVYNLLHWLLHLVY